MEDVQSLYDQYTYGRLDPEAIRIFLDSGLSHLEHSACYMCY